MNATRSSVRGAGARRRGGRARRRRRGRRRPGRHGRRGRRRAQRRLDRRCSSATTTSAASPPAAWCWCSTTCGTARQRDLRARRLPRPDRAPGRARPGGLSAPGRMGQRAAAALQRWTRWGAFDFHTPDKPHPIVLRRRLRSRRLEARLATRWWREHGVDLRLHSWFSHALVEDGRINGVVCETKSGRAGDPGRRRDRRHRRPRRRRLGRRAAHRRRLHRDHRVPPRRRRHRRRRALRARGARALRRARQARPSASSAAAGTTGG